MVRTLVFNTDIAIYSSLASNSQFFLLILLVLQCSTSKNCRESFPFSPFPSPPLPCPLLSFLSLPFHSPSLPFPSLPPFLYHTFCFQSFPILTFLGWHLKSSSPEYLPSQWADTSQCSVMTVSVTQESRLQTPTSSVPRSQDAENDRELRGWGKQTRCFSLACFLKGLFYLVLFL